MLICLLMVPVTSGCEWYDIFCKWDMKPEYESNGVGEEPSLLSIGNNKCPLDSEYEMCYEDAYGWGFSIAHSVLQMNFPKDINGNTNEHLVEEATIEVKCDGFHYPDGNTKFYYYENINDWSDISCDENGCSGEEIANGVRTLQHEVGEVPAPFFVCHDYAYTSYTGDWAYVYMAVGWFNDDGSWNYKVVNCNEHGDCEETEMCDKDGDWDTWECSVPTPTPTPTPIPTETPTPEPEPEEDNGFLVFLSVLLIGGGAILWRKSK